MRFFLSKSKENEIIICYNIAIVEVNNMKIEIWSDFACPFCYIGKKRFEAALSKFSNKDKVEVIYKAYQLNPNAPKQMAGSAYEAFASGHQVSIEQAKKRFKMFEDNAKTVGLTYNYDIIQMTNTFDAHRVHKYAQSKGLGDLLGERLMKAYFSEGQNLSDYKTLISLASSVGLDEKAVETVLNDNAFKDLVLAEQQEARQIGVQGVPFFVINRKYGVSGAQDEIYFLNALNQIWQEEQPLKVMNNSDASCDTDCAL